MRVTKGSTAQSKYDMTGYVDSYKNDSLSFENENTGETVKYPIKSGAKIVVGGQTVTRTQLKTLLDDHYKEHAYAGIKTTMNLMPTRFFTVAVPPVPGTKISTGPPWAMLRS